MAKTIGDTLALGQSHANIDYYYGPYTTKEEACAKVKAARGLGLTVGIYQFKEDNMSLWKILEDIVTGKIRYEIEIK